MSVLLRPLPRVSPSACRGDAVLGTGRAERFRARSHLCLARPVFPWFAPACLHGRKNRVSHQADLREARMWIGRPRATPVKV